MKRMLLAGLLVAIAATSGLIAASDGNSNGSEWGAPPFERGEAEGTEWSDVRIDAPLAPCLSPSGQLLAFTRRHLRQSHRDTYSWRDTGRFLTLIPWVRNLETGDVWSLNTTGAPVQWIGDEALVLSTGRIVDPVSGKEIDRYPRLPENVTVWNAAWSPDGSKLAYIVAEGELMPHGQIFLRDSSGRTHRIERRWPLYGGGPLWWSPDGRWVAYDVHSFCWGQPPVRMIGVIDSTTRTAYDVGEWGYGYVNRGFESAAYFPAFGSPWSPDGAYVAFVVGRGGPSADVFLLRIADRELLRITGERLPCWSPSFDSTGRRLAYWAADRSEESGEILGAHLRVLDIYTGESRRIDPAGNAKPGSGHVVRWGADSARLIYDWYEYRPIRRRLRFDPQPEPEAEDPREHDGIFFVAVEEPQQPPAGQAPRVVEITHADEVIHALGSDIASLVDWGLEQAETIEDPRLVPTLREALLRWLDQDSWHPIEYILRFLRRHGIREAIPEIRRAVGLDMEYGPATAIGTLIEWNATEALDDLRHVADQGANTVGRVWATVAITAFGDDRWDDVRAWATRNKHEDDRYIRKEAMRALGLVRDSRVVPILIDGLRDQGRVLLSPEYRVQHVAYQSLVRLTDRREFGLDQQRWRTWWREQNEQLPEAPPEGYDVPGFDDLPHE